jgi:fumarate hydratase class II
MASGPRCGLAEIHLPDLQPGSSIMPGKVNPVVPEAVCQVVAQVVGNDAAVAFGGTAGNFELNVMLPVIGRNLLESIRLLASASGLLADKCVAGIEADAERCRVYALSSPAIATALNPRIGYEAAARVVKESASAHQDLRTVVVERGLLTAADADRVLDVLAMTKGGVSR